MVSRLLCLAARLGYFLQLRPIAFYSISEIRFCDSGQVRAREVGWLLYELVLARSYRKQQETRVFAEIVGRRVHQTATIFYEHKIEPLEIPRVERILNQRCLAAFPPSSSPADNFLGPCQTARR
jgi:hypothetical protein